MASPVQKRIYDKLAPLTYNPQNALSVDPYAYLTTFTGEFTANTTGDIDQDIITPPTDKAITTYFTLLTTDSTSGVISLDFPTSGKVVNRLYASIVNRTTWGYAKVTGGTNEKLKLKGVNLDAGSKVFVIVLYTTG